MVERLILTGVQDAKPWEKCRSQELIYINRECSLKDAMAETRGRVDRLSIPTLCYHGGDDRLVPTESSEILEGLPDVERWVVPGMRHEVHNEPGGLDVIADVIGWIDRQLALAADESGEGPAG